MDNTPDMIATYHSMLATVAMQATSDGFVRMSVGDGEYLPVTAKDGATVVLPIPERLRDPKVKEYEVFHLLAEHTKTKDTDLLGRYRHWLINRFNIVIGGLGAALLGIAADEALCKKLRPDQKEFLSLVAEADGTSSENFSKIANLCAKPSQTQRLFMTMYLRPAGVLEGKSYHRVASVNFPFYDELAQLALDEIEYKKSPKTKKAPKPEREVFGVPIRIKDCAAFDGLMRYLIPNLETKRFYDVGSNSRVAPGLDALMMSFFPMAKHLNDIIDVFKGVDNNMDRALDEMTFDLDWVTAFENLDSLWTQIRMVPAQSHGVAKEPEPISPVVAPTPPIPGRQPPPWEVSSNPYPAPQVQTNTYGNIHQSSATKGAVNVSDMMNRQMRGSRQPIQGNGYGSPAPAQGYGQNQGGGYPAPMVNNPMGGNRRY